MSVIAEWVSTDEQNQRLRLLGCDYVQGNHRRTGYRRRIRPPHCRPCRK